MPPSSEAPHPGAQASAWLGLSAQGQPGAGGLSWGPEPRERVTRAEVRLGAGAPRALRWAALRAAVVLLPGLGVQGASSLHGDLALGVPLRLLPPGSLTTLTIGPTGALNPLINVPLMLASLWG